ncbi:MAG: integrase [Pseudomonadota bacterium]
MNRAIRYRVGTHAKTGELLAGFAHVQQSLGVIWGTRLGQLVMELGFGSNLFDLLGEDLTVDLAFDIYDALITSAHKYEDEYRLTSLQLVKVERTGLLGLRYEGNYYPEGRFGKYDLIEPGGAVFLPTYAASSSLEAAA